MDYDNYVTLIAQKYRLAITLSVIRTKPNNTNLEDYIQSLRDKLNEDMNDSDNLNISLCSDDFHFDETDDFNINIDNIEVNNDGYNDQLAQPRYENSKNNDGTEINELEIIGIQDLNDLDINMEEDNDQSKKTTDFNEEIFMNAANDVEMISTQKSNNSITILQNFENVEMEPSKSLNDVIKILKDTDESAITIEKVISKQIPQSTHFGILQTQASEVTDLTQSITDNDTTLYKSLDILINEDKFRQEYNYNCNVKHILTQKDGEIEKSMQKDDVNTKSNNSKENNNIGRNQTTFNTEYNIPTSNIENQSKYETKQNSINLVNRLNLAESKPQSKIREYPQSNKFKNIYQNVADIFRTEKNKTVHEVNDKTEMSKNKSKLHSVSQDSKDTYALSEEFTCRTHYSETQVHNFIVDDKYIHGTNRNNNKLGNKDFVDATGNKKKNKAISNNFPSQESLLSNISTWSAKSNQHFEAANIISDKNKNRADEDLIEGNVILVDNNIFSQESQLTNVFTLSPNNSQLYDKNNEKYTKESDKTSNKDIDEYSNNKSNVVNKIKYVDKDLFSQESQLTYFLTLPMSGSQNKVSEHSLSFSKDAQNMNENFDCIQTQKSQEFIADSKKSKDTNQKCTAFDKNFKNTLVTNERCNINNNDENSENLVTEEVVMSKRDTNLVHPITIEKQKSCTNIDTNIETLQVIELKKPCTKFDEKTNMLATKDCTNVRNIENMEVEDWTDSQKELIPFKVIEELNKIKMYINRRNDKKMSLEGHSSDTGYKSDSQSKNSHRMSQTSSGWLDQSAHSLFNHVIDCPLVATTEDITNEVSVVLGHLIDMLHEEEIYPSFLEELLDSVQLLLGLVYEENGDQNVLLKKDETIQRILLLNKSIHIQKYTIEKITYILENLHTELTTNDLYEIRNITQIENICYVFHILEIILQKYNKISQNLSQSTQNSQENEKVLKKSSIIDIWRKKWNPSYKESQNEGSPEKICVLSNCRAVLNKLVVGCMEGYSLVSYFALKCFNVMQT